MKWEAFNKFEEVTDKYMPDMGEGDTMASQAVTAVNKIVYRWFNDGDIYDNHYYLSGWENDLSSYANWLFTYADADVLCDIEDVSSEEEYSDLLYDLCEEILNPERLERMRKEPKVGSIYECDGNFSFEYIDDEEDDDLW